MTITILILLVEDEDATRLILEETLREGGFELKVAANGDEALRVLQSEHQTLRGLITDINLGAGPDGWDVARRARELHPDLPVVYMSGAAGAEWTSQGVPHSTLDSKPFAPAQIVTAISALLNASDSQP
jgi:CheY-like chemotaxis protein